MSVALFGAPAWAVDEEAFPWANRHFFPLRDINLSEYETDPEWNRLTESSAQSKSGVDFWYGSLSERRLGREMRIQLHAQLTDRLRFRFLREDVANEEIEAGHDRLELQYRVAGPLSLTASGFGALEKSEAAFGVGFLLVNRRRDRYLDVTIRNDAIVYDDRTPYESREPMPPLRVIAEGNWQHRGSRVYGFTDWGLGHRRVFDSPRGSDGYRERRDWTRRLELKAERDVGSNLVLGLRHRYSSQGDARELFPEYDDPEFQLLSFAFRRDHHRTDLFWEAYAWNLRMYGIAGFWRQTEHANFAVHPDYRVDRRQVIFGGRALYRINDTIEAGVGYWGAYLDSKRTVATAPGVRVDYEPRNAEIYADKIDAVVTYVWSDTMRFEGILSQEFTRGEFGGGCGKAVILF